MTLAKIINGICITNEIARTATTTKTALCKWTMATLVIRWRNMWHFISKFLLFWLFCLYMFFILIELKPYKCICGRDRILNVKLFSLFNEQTLQGNWHFHILDEKHFLKLLPLKFLSNQCFLLLLNLLFACYYWQYLWWPQLDFLLSPEE